MLNSWRNIVTQFWRRQRRRRPGVILDPAVTLGRAVALRPGYLGQRGRIQLAGGCRLEDGVLLEAWGGHITLGRDVFVGPYTVIYGHGGVEIGDACLIAMHCRIVSSNHAIPSMGTSIRNEADELRPTRIGRDVWMGAGVTILGGVTVGDGCVIGAGSVVTGDLAPGSIALGVPARLVRSRSPA